MILSERNIENRTSKPNRHIYQKKPKKGGNPYNQRRLCSKGNIFNKRR